MQFHATEYFNKRITVSKLEAELKGLRQLAEDKRKLRDKAASDYAEVAKNIIQLERLLRVKKASENAASSSGDSVDFLAEPTDQTAAVLQVIRAGGESGIRPKQIEQLLASNGIVVKPAYVHTILMRLKKRKEVKSVRGSYFAVE
jgi:predicted RNA-binding Zn ribbon-like protein